MANHDKYNNNQMYSLHAALKMITQQITTERTHLLDIQRNK